MEIPNIDHKEFYTLQSDVKVLSATQARLESSIKSLETLKQMFLVAITVMSVLGLGGGFVATYTFNQFKTRLNVAEGKLKLIEDGGNLIQGALQAAKTNFEEYAQRRIPEISKQALDEIHRFGIQDIEFTDDNGGTRTRFESGTANNHQGKDGEIWLLIGDRANQKVEHDNYLILRRPSK